MQQESPGSDATDTMGICTSVFGHRHALTPAKLRRLGETGIRWIEIAALQTQHLNLFDAQRVDEVAEALDALPCNVWSLHAPFCGLAMDDPDTRADGLRKLRQAVRAAQRFGAVRIIVHPGRDVPSADRPRELQWLRDGFARAAEHLPPGMVLALETMGLQSLAGPHAEMLDVIGGLDDPRVGVCLDTGHVHTGGDPAAYARAVAGLIATVHLHDNAGDRDAHAMPGEGTIRWPECLSAIRDAGYTGPWICEAGLEAAPTTLSPTDLVRQFVRRMTAYLSEAGIA